jgi:hypothetical protein
LSGVGDGVVLAVGSVGFTKFIVAIQLANCNSNGLIRSLYSHGDLAVFLASNAFSSTVANSVANFAPASHHIVDKIVSCSFPFNFQTWPVISTIDAMTEFISHSFSASLFCTSLLSLKNHEIIENIHLAWSINQGLIIFSILAMTISTASGGNLEAISF